MRKKNTTVPVPEEEPTQEAAGCNAPAPLVVNGSAYVGCMLTDQHEGDHEILIRWRR